MDPYDRQRATIISTIVRDVPRAFWDAIGLRTRQTYLDVFHQILNDPNLLGEQKIDALYQMRHLRMENLLKVLADEHGLAASATVLVENNRRYVYASSGAVGLTQAYVPAIGDMPKPARFRERHSALNRIVKEPGFNFGLEPAELLVLKAFYGLIAHNPIGKRFVPEDQGLGMIQFCVPVDDCSKWAAQLTIHEIIAAYDVAKPEKKPDRGPQWKKDRDVKGEGEGKE